jgi:hypothetical protein
MILHHYAGGLSNYSTLAAKLAGGKVSKLIVLDLTLASDD